MIARHQATDTTLWRHRLATGATSGGGLPVTTATCGRSGCWKWRHWCGSWRMMTSRWTVTRTAEEKAATSTVTCIRRTNKLISSSPLTIVSKFIKIKYLFSFKVWLYENEYEIKQFIINDLWIIPDKFWLRSFVLLLLCVS